MPKERHGMVGTPTYRTWENMIQRCCNPNNTSYPNYGGRGIIVCNDWRDFSNFFADMGERPEGMTIERKDSNGDYEPSNCRWATRQEQQWNLRTNYLVEYQGETKSQAEWARLYGLKTSTLRGRLNAGWGIERALFTPVTQTMTLEVAKAIRYNARQGLSISQLSEMFQTSKRNVQHILNGDSWTDGIAGKCPTCKRAIDDPAVGCTPFDCENDEQNGPIHEY